jgi:hypothetical protein
MKAYISGPMTGIEYFNFPLFNEVEYFLKTKGYEVINPAFLTLQVLKEKIKNFFIDPENYDYIVKVIEEHPEITYDDYLNKDLKEIENCDCVVMLSNWKNSTGAMKEYRKAIECKKEIFELKGKELTMIY